ncbi:hypothetical protein Poly51_06800 [Rubripirellula tenax]|uniref:Uncharacterized protein n=1 Tax=Rubripirellula tenax TaxID=2528015 RepID=A0A5C6FKU2_9BACT|nr:hypothetical protein Poly51_06800 [Rubripirellula tenax]
MIQDGQPYVDPRLRSRDVSCKAADETRSTPCERSRRATKGDPKRATLRGPATPLAGCQLRSSRQNRSTPCERSRRATKGDPKRATLRGPATPLAGCKLQSSRRNRSTPFSSALRDRTAKLFDPRHCYSQYEKVCIHQWGEKGIIEVPNPAPQPAPSQACQVPIRDVGASRSQCVRSKNTTPIP